MMVNAMEENKQRRGKACWAVIFSRMVTVRLTEKTLSREFNDAQE